MRTLNILTVLLTLTLVACAVQLAPLPASPWGDLPPRPPTIA